jgi:hypothetical protein
MNARTTFRIERALSILFGAAALLTIAWPDWIEGVFFSVDPDGHSGGAEWLLVGVLGLGAALLGIAARREQRQLESAGA